MSKWNSIPNEVLQLIFLKLYINTGDLKHCIFVNKQWFLVALPIIYNKVLMSLGKRKLIQTLLHSKYQPGQCVKKMTFLRDFGPPPDVNLISLDASTDVLCQLIRHCPKVKEIEGFFHDDSRSEEYLFTALSVLKIWRLKIIPPARNWTSLAQYNRLAHLFQDSLEHLELHQEEDNYDYLKQFTRLKSLSVQFSKHANMTQCVKFMNNVPLLEILYVWFDKESVSKNSVNDSEWNGEIMQAEPYNKMKDLNLSNFTPMNDEEIEFIIDKFRHLDLISITTNHTFWVKQASRATVLNFLNYLQKIPSYHLGFALEQFDKDTEDDNNNNIRFLKLYYQAFQHRQYHFIELHFTEEYYNNSLQISSKGQLSVTLGSCDEKNHDDMAEQVLKAIGVNLQQILVVYEPHNNGNIINRNLFHVLEYCPHVQTVTFYGGAISSDYFRSKKKFALKALTLSKTKIYQRSLVSLLRKFSGLDSLCLQDCTFPKEQTLFAPNGMLGMAEEEEDGSVTKDTDMVFEMTNATFKSLELIESASSFAKPAVINYVFVLARFKTRKVITHEHYYIVRNKGRDITHYKNKTQFFNARKTIKTDYRLFIQLNAQGIESFTFTIPGQVEFTLDLSPPSSA